MDADAASALRDVSKAILQPELSGALLNR